MQNLKSALKMKIYPPHYYRSLLKIALMSGQNVPHSLFLNLDATTLRYGRIAKNRATPVNREQHPIQIQHNAKLSMVRGVGRIHHVFFHSRTKEETTKNVQRRMILVIGVLRRHLFHGVILGIAMKIVQ